MNFLIDMKEETLTKLEIIYYVILALWLLNSIVILVYMIMAKPIPHFFGWVLVGFSVVALGVYIPIYRHNNK